MRILITGGAGSIGTALGRALELRGVEVAILDLRASGESKGDIRDASSIRHALRQCTGIIHLAAVSRVAWGEQDPRTCESINVDGTRQVCAAACEFGQPPWLLFASSREVYGEPAEIPVVENAPLRPINVYGRSKVDGEMLVAGARNRGLRAAIVRLSNVYGGAQDHTDRAVPTFSRAALRGAAIDVAGTHRAFDFTHIEDVVRGICSLVELLDAGETPPPIQLATGAATSLGELARIAVEAAGSRSVIREHPAGSFEVSRFVGDPRRARAILGWEAQIAVRDGMTRLIREQRTDPGDTAVLARTS